MHKLLDEYLCKKYPKIFADRRKPMNETCMCWGFSHDDGWFHLIDTLCGAIQSHIDSNNEWVEEYGLPAWKKIQDGTVEKDKFDWLEKEPQLIPQVVADQVKEKFGTLRFYYHGGDEKIHGMVQMAEWMSSQICEVCGRMDELVNQNSKGWIRTTCPCCVESHLKENHLQNRDTELAEIWEKVRNEPKKTSSEKIEESFKVIEEIKSYGKE